MKRIEVTYTTMGQGNPYTVGERKDYTWNGDPAKSEQARKAGQGRRPPKPRSEVREERLAVYTAARERGLGIGPAGREAGVVFKTAQGYERDRIARAGTREAADA